MLFENCIGKVYVEASKVYVSTPYYRYVIEVFYHDT